MSSESILIVTDVPAFASPEEHRNIVASTPPSFNDIPPVLRHKEENVKITLDPPLEGFTPGDGDNGVLYIIERYANCHVVYLPPFTRYPVRSCSCRPLAVDCKSRIPQLPSTRYHAQKEARHPYTVN